VLQIVIARYGMADTPNAEVTLHTGNHDAIPTRNRLPASTAVFQRRSAILLACTCDKLSQEACVASALLCRDLVHERTQQIASLVRRAR
jgi:hypothetical protein